MLAHFKMCFFKNRLFNSFNPKQKQNTPHTLPLLGSVVDTDDAPLVTPLLKVKLLPMCESI